MGIGPEGAMGALSSQLAMILSWGDPTDTLQDA